MAGAAEGQRRRASLYPGSRDRPEDLAVTLSNDSFALLLLCAHLGLPDEPEVRPLSAREWSKLEPRLAASLSIAEMPGSSAARIKSTLRADNEEAARLASLLDRGSVLKEELDRLAELGIWVITRFDEAYPARLSERLKSGAPVMLYGAGEAALLKRRGLAVVGSRNVDPRGFALTELVGNAC